MNVIQFPTPTSCIRTKQIITRAQEMGIAHLIERAGLTVGDTVKHTTYGWSGEIIAFDMRAPNAKHVVVSVPMGAAAPVAIHVAASSLRLVKAGVA